MLLSKSPPTSPSPRAVTAPNASGPRAPAVRMKLEAAQAELAALDAEVAALTLDDAEDKPGARKALTAHRSDTQAAERRVDELKRALALASKLDKQAAAAGAVRMRDEQYTALKQQFAARQKAAETVMRAVADLSTAYGKFSECSLNIASVMPSGTVLPTMSIGPNGIYGPALGPCGQLILAELWRIAPERRDGTGRFVLPFVKPGIELLKDVAELPVGIDELRAADQAILANISEQVESLNEAAMRAADMIDETAAPAAADAPLPLSFAEALLGMAAGQPGEVPAPAPAQERREITPPPLPSVPAFDAFTMSDADAIAGLTAEDCCKACSEKGCVLTGGIRCAHPHKGGLAKADQLRPEVMTRYATACTSAGLKNIRAPEPEEATA